MRDRDNPHFAKSQVMKKYGLTDQEMIKILHPFETVKRRRDIAKQKMIDLGFEITYKYSDTAIDLTKMKGSTSSNIDFPSEYTIITPRMITNF